MQEAWDQIEAIPGYARKKSGIPKIREFLGLLGDPDREFQVIHVAGTNGKGSVCAFLTSMLCEAGIPSTFTERSSDTPEEGVEAKNSCKNEISLSQRY